MSPRPAAVSDELAGDRLAGDSLAGIVLAAGEGRRLRPLTEHRPKPLCPVQLRPLLDWAMDRVTPHTGTGPRQVAVNAHHLAEQVVAHVGDRARVVVEPELLGTAGAVGNLLDWVAGRDVLLTNSDAFLSPGIDALDELVTGSRDRLRLLVIRPEAGQNADFADPAGDPRGWRYIGGCLLPWAHIKDLQTRPSGLYEVCWRAVAERDEIDFVEFTGTAVDCGTPADYLRANLAGGVLNVVDPDAHVRGQINQCVVWKGGVVAAGENLVRCIRTGADEGELTVSTDRS